MNKFLKITLLVVASIMSVNAVAQNQWSVTAGYQKSDNRASASTGGTTITTNCNGFFAGVGYEAPIKGIQNLYFEGQFLYSYLGDRDGDVTENLHSLLVPLRAKYKMDLTDQFGIFAYGGPVASLGIGANAKQGNVSYSLYGKDGIINRFDVKLGIGAGIELSHKVVFRIGYDWGLFNASLVDGVKMNINLLQIGVAYNL